MANSDRPMSGGPPVAAFCTQCGRHAEPADRFCAGCGHSVRPRPAGPGTDDPAGEALRAAQQLLADGRLRDAISALERLCADAPQRSAARVILGVAYLRAGRVHEAEATLEEAEQLAPHTFACEVAWAEYHARLGFVDRAVARLDRALALPVSDPRARDAAVELHRYCSERSKKLFYRTTPLPTWSFRRRRHLDATPADTSTPA